MSLPNVATYAILVQKLRFTNVAKIIKCCISLKNVVLYVI